MLVDPNCAMAGGVRDEWIPQIRVIRTQGKKWSDFDDEEPRLHDTLFIMHLKQYRFVLLTYPAGLDQTNH
jgi:hypothetical protein